MIRLSYQRAQRIAALIMACGVACGAFGAHLLESRVTVEMLKVWQTGVLYHLLHGLALYFLAGQAAGRRDASSGPWVTMLFGTVIFSSTLYILALSGAKWWGAITPVGGTLLIASWLWLAWNSSSPTSGKHQVNK